MTKILFTFTKVECNHTWQDENDTSTHTFGSHEGAREWIEKNKDTLRWASLMTLDACPCDEDDIGGKLFYGMKHSEYHEFNRG